MQVALKMCRQPLLIFIFFSFIAATLLAPIALNSFAPDSPDLLNHLAYIIKAKSALHEGQFPLREILYDQNGWRYPAFQFYSPTGYTFAALIYQFLSPSNPFTAYKITLWITSVFGSIYMYRLSLWFLESKGAAILASVIYLTTPYYLIVMDHMFGFTEGMALGILPSVLYYNFRGFSASRTFHAFIPIALSWYLLITIHLITFIYSALLIGIVFTLRTLQNNTKWKDLIYIGLAFFLACLLATWFLAPILILEKLFIIHKSFNSFTQLHTPLLGLFSFNANFLKPANGNLHLVPQLNPAIGWTLILSAGVCLYAILTKNIVVQCRMNPWLPIFIATFALTFFLVWTPFNFWQWLPQSFMVGQYSWRFLGQMIWMGALLSGWAILHIANNKIGIRQVVLGTLLIFIMTSPWLPIINLNTVSLSKFFIQPFIVYNPDAYQLDARQNPNLINNIKNLSLDEIVINSILQLDKPYIIPRLLLNYNVKPAITLQGSILLPNTENTFLLTLVNGIVIDKHRLKSGAIDWNILLYNLPIQFKNQNLTIQFKIDKEEVKSKTVITVKKLMLTGFFNSSDILNLTQQDCKIIKSSTLCSVNVTPNIKLIQLPIYYYPGLLNVSLNDNKISYTSILDEKRAMTAIKPEPGKINIIKIRFQGLVLANFISTIAWYGIISLSIFFLIHFFLKRKK